ncbi:hypothetical protein [Acidisoma silvae]|uniref:Lipoprotein n=1 Tax=Acidisoma silvae TaxID=2802396 RepID=A0A963YWI7_9PROT|nr:hypothetical protein [Acidisoma silvae]MCB8878434.1 hypothetical protein [Acidisoma silvae]
MKHKFAFPSLALIAATSLAGCNGPGHHASANFHAAGQAIGNGNVGDSAGYTGHAFTEGAQATGQAISNGSQQAGKAITGNNNN